ARSGSARSGRPYRRRDRADSFATSVGCRAAMHSCAPSFCVGWSVIVLGWRLQHATGNTTSLLELGQQLRQWRNIVVAFDRCCGSTKQPQRFGVNIPHRRNDRMVMGIDEVVATIEVTGDVNLPHTLRRHIAQIFARIEAVIESA